jgi:hypothetical protein
MPRYFFKVIRNGEASPASDALDLADNAAAWEEGTIACGEMIRSIDGRFPPGADWKMEVFDDSGKMIFRFRFTADSFV